MRWFGLCQMCLRQCGCGWYLSRCSLKCGTAIGLCQFSREVFVSTTLSCFFRRQRSGRGPGASRVRLTQSGRPHTDLLQFPAGKACSVRINGCALVLRPHLFALFAALLFCLCLVRCHHVWRGSEVSGWVVLKLAPSSPFGSF